MVFLVSREGAFIEGLRSKNVGVLEDDWGPTVVAGKTGRPFRTPPNTLRERLLLLNYCSHCSHFLICVISSSDKRLIEI